MKTKLFLLSVLGAFILISGCEDLLDEDDANSTVQRLEGVWQCDDAPATKSALFIYQVYITPSTVDSSEISLSNFHKLGNNVEALGRVSGSSITLSKQTLTGGYTIRGSGTISSDIKEIAWTYYIDDGSGQEEEVDAVYTFLY